MSVIVRAGEVAPEGLDVDLQVDIRVLTDESGLEIGVGRATLKAHVHPARGGLQCSGQVLATAFPLCSRCLEPYALRVDREFDVAFLAAPPAVGPGGIELEITRGDLDVSYLDERRALDMDHLAAEQIYLELPMKPLCSPQCKGLCVGCGSNLNLDRCRCTATA